MTIKYECDKCYGITSLLISLTISYIASNATRIDHTFHVCQKCKEDFALWINCKLPDL